MSTDTKTPQPQSATLAKVESGLSDRRVEIWTKERVDLLKRAIVTQSNGKISDDEFALFLEQCRRQQVDPLLGEADCIPRNVKVKRMRKGDNGREYEVTEYETRWTFQMRENAMNKRADSFPDFEGCASGAVREGDICEIDRPNGTVKHVYNAGDPARRTKNLVSAWAIVRRRGRMPTVVELTFSSRKGEGAFWEKDPEGMLAKCARYAAWRQAYPSVFGEQYAEEEMLLEAQQASSSPPSPALQQPASANKADELAAKLAAKVGTHAEPRREKEINPMLPAPSKGPAIAFGPRKGVPLTALTSAELEAFADAGHARLASQPEAPWAASLKASLVEIGEELARRQHAADQANSEPGAEG